jgi:hypothetical protein
MVCFDVCVGVGFGYREDEGVTEGTGEGVGTSVGIGVCEGVCQGVCEGVWYGPEKGKFFSVQLGHAVQSGLVIRYQAHKL